MLDFVLMDLDNTILSFSIAEETAIRKTFLDLSIPPTRENIDRYSQLNAFCWEQMEDGKLAHEDVYWTRFEMLFHNMGVSRSSREAEAIYEDYLCQGYWFMPGARNLLDYLKGKYALFLVSNGSRRVQNCRLDSSGIRPYFDGIFISEDIGYDKPDRRFFDACFRQIPDFNPSRAIIIGDSLTSDIRGGINAGICTCWYNYNRRPGRDSIRPDYEVHNLDHIPLLLEKIFGDDSRKTGDAECT